MNLSVILCTWNNSSRLEITLKNFLEIEVPHAMTWELVVVNNNSTDLTNETVQYFTHRLPIKYVEENNQGLSYARNAGLRAATGDLIIFTDDDVKPCKDWLRIYWEAYQKNPDDYFWGGPIESEFEEPPPDMELIRLGPCSVKGLDWGTQHKILNLDGGEYFIAANWGCPAKALSVVGEFDVHLGLNPSSNKVLVGEENNLMNRLVIGGLNPLYLPDAKIQHFVPKSKVTLEHIAVRKEATGYISAESLICNHDVQLFGVPRWLIFKCFSFWFKFFFNRCLFREWHSYYLEYRFLVGCIKGIKKQ